MESKYRLNDDILESVSGGTGIVPDDPQANGRCPGCGSLLMTDGIGYRCPDCNETYTQAQLMGGAAPGVTASSAKKPTITSTLFKSKRQK